MLPQIAMYLHTASRTECRYHEREVLNWQHCSSKGTFPSGGLRLSPRRAPGERRFVGAAGLQKGKAQALTNGDNAALADLGNAQLTPKYHFVLSPALLVTVVTVGLGGVEIRCRTSVFLTRSASSHRLLGDLVGDLGELPAISYPKI